MRVYVAGRTTDLDRVRNAQRLFESAGHEITCDWTMQVDYFTSNPDQLDDINKRACASGDLEGVLSADLVCVMMNGGMCGSYIEIGAALAAGKNVWLVGKPERDSVFFYLPGVYFILEEKLFDVIKGINPAVGQR
jgi:hypothetical protein